MPLDIRFTDAPLGHEIRGVDLAKPIEDAVFAEIEAAFDAYGVVVFRGQRLSPQQQMDYSRRFGDLEVYPLGAFNMEGVPEVMIVSNVVENGKPIGMADAGRYWHSDMWYTTRPPRGSLLYAVEVPERDGQVFGDTMFGSMAAAYDALPDATKQRLEGRLGVFSYQSYLSHRRSTMASESRSGESAQSERERYAFPDLVHPLVRRHPRTGRKSLYLSQGVVSRIEGMVPEESDALIAELERHMVRPEFVYRHNWRVGDLVMWDNCSAIHRAIADFALPLRRRMHRTTVAGTELI